MDRYLRTGLGTRIASEAIEREAFDHEKASDWG